MVLSADEIACFKARTRQVGEAIGWDLQFVVGPIPENVMVTVLPTNTILVGPGRLSNGAAEDFADVLDRLENHTLVIATDDDGDPYIVNRADAEKASQRNPGAGDRSSANPPFSEDRPDTQRVFDIVGDAMVAVLRGDDPEVAAIELVGARRPTAVELAAARDQNQETHSGLTPDSLRGLLPQSPVHEDVVRLRHGIDEVLAAAQRRLEGT